MPTMTRTLVTEFRTSSGQVFREFSTVSDDVTPEEHARFLLGLLEKLGDREKWWRLVNEAQIVDIRFVESIRVFDLTDFSGIPAPAESAFKKEEC